MQNTRHEWKKVVKGLYSRKNMDNYTKSVEAVNRLGYPTHLQNPTIIDAYPGAGVFTAALYNCLNPSIYLALEPFKSYSRFLQSFELDNFKTLEQDPYRWSTYTELEQLGLLKPQKVPPSEVHNSLLFTANLSHAQGEQLVTQYLNCIMNRSWLLRYGRVRLLLWMRSSVAEKLLAGPGEMARHRIGVQREACCDAKVVFHQGTPSQVAKKDSKKTQLYPSLLKHPLLTLTNKDIAATMTVPLSLVELTPKEVPIEYPDEFEYVTRTLFILSSQPLRQSLAMLGPGAEQHLATELEDLLDIKPTSLTGEQILRVVHVFWKWPFKPDCLHDFFAEKFLATGYEGP